MALDKLTVAKYSDSNTVAYVTKAGGAGSLTTSDIKLINASGHTVLSVLNATQIGQLSVGLTPDQTSGLTANQVSGLTETQIKTMTDAQVQALNAGGLTAVQLGDQDKAGRTVLSVLTGTQIGQLAIGLTLDQTRGLTVPQVSGLTAAQIGVMTDAQVQSLNAGGLATVQLGYKDKAGKTVLSLLTGPQIGQLSIGLTLDQTRGLTSDQVGGLTTSQINLMTDTQVQALNAAGLTVAQLGCQDKSRKTVLSLLTSDQIGQLYSANLSKLNSDQVSGLSKDQFSGMTDAQVQSLNTSGLIAVQLGYKDNADKTVLSVLTSTQIGKLDATITSGLNTTQIAGLTANQVSGLTSSQINMMTDTQVQTLNATGLTAAQLGNQGKSGRTVLSVLTDTQIGQLGLASLSKLTANQVAGLNKAQFSWMTDAQVQTLNATGLSMAQLGYTDSAKRTVLSVLTTIQIGQLAIGLTLDQTLGLTADQVGGLTATQIKGMTDTQVQALNTGGMTVVQLGYQNKDGKTVLSLLTASQIGKLGASIPSGLTTAQMTGLTADQVGGLTAPQIGVMADAQVQTLNTVGLTGAQLGYLDKAGNVVISVLTGTQIGQLAPKNLSGLTTGQVAGLTAVQIGGMTDAQIQALVGAGGLISVQLGYLDKSGKTVLSLLTSTQIGQLAIGLTLDQIHGLTVPQVGGLTANQIGRMTDAQVLALNAGGLTATQLGYQDKSGKTVLSLLTSTQIGQLNSTILPVLTASQIAGLASDQVGALTSSQINMMTDAQVQAVNAAGLTVAQLGYQDKSGKTVLSILTSTQIGQLGLSRLSKLTTDQVGGLSADQITGMTDAQVQTLNASGLIVSQLEYKDTAKKTVLSVLTSTQIGQLTTGLTLGQTIVLTADQVGGLTSTQIKKMTDTQIQALDASGLNVIQLGCQDIANKTVLSVLTSTQIGKLGSTICQLTAAQIAGLTAGQVGGLTTLQVGGLTAAQVDKLTVAQIGAMTDVQVQALDTSGLTQIWSENKAGHHVLEVLTANQVGQLSFAVLSQIAVPNMGIFTAPQIGGLTMTQITWLTSAQIAGLAVNGWTATQIGWMTDVQVQALDASGLTAAQLGYKYKAGKTVLSVLTGTQIGKLGQAILSGLTAAQIAGLTSQQIAWLTTEQIGGLAADGLTATQIGQMTDVQVQALDGCDLTAGQLWYKDITGKTVLSVLTGTQIGKLGLTTLSGLTVSQIAGLTSDQIGGLTNAAQIRVLAAPQIAGLTADQIGGLTSTQIGWMSDMQVQALNAAGLTAVHLGYNDSPGNTVLSVLTGTQIGKLGSTSLSELTASQTSGLTAAQIAWMRDEQVQALNAGNLTGAQLGYQDKSGKTVLSLLTANQIKKLVIGGLTLDQIRRLSTNQVGGLTEAQIAMMTDAQVQALDAHGLTGKQLSYHAKSGKAMLLVLTKEQIEQSIAPSVYVKQDQVAKLTATQVGWMSDWQVITLQPGCMNAAQLGYKDKTGNTVLSLLIEGQVEQLSLKALSDLTNDQLAGLTMEQISWLIPSQVAGLSATLMARMTDAQVKMLNASGLTRAQLGYGRTGIPGSTLLSVLTGAQIGELDWTTFSVFSDAEIKKLSMEQVQGMSDDQVKYVIDEFNGDDLKYFLSVFTSKQISGLSEDCINNLGIDQIHSITAVDGFSSDALNYITKIKGDSYKIKLSDTDSAIHYYKTIDVYSKLFQCLSSDQVAHLTGRQVSDIFKSSSPSGDRMEQWDKKLLPSLTADQLNWVDDLGIPVISSLNKAALTTLDYETIRNLSVTSLLALSSDGALVVSLFCGDVSDEQWHDLTADNLRGLTPSLRHEVLYNALEHLDRSAIAGLTVSDIEGFITRYDNSVQVLFAFTPDQIKGLTSGQLHSLSSDNRKWLLHNHLDDLSTEAVSGLTADDLTESIVINGKASTALSILNNKQISGLTSTQFSGLSEGYRKNLVQERVSCLDASIIKTLTSTELQTTTTTGVSTLLALTKEQVAWLTQEQVANLLPVYRASLAKSQFKYMNASAIGGLSASDLTLDITPEGKTITILEALTPEQLGGLTAQQISCFSHDQRELLQVSYLGKYAIQGFLPYELELNTLNVANGKYAPALTILNSDQINGLTAGQVAGLTAVSRLWLVQNMIKNLSPSAIAGLSASDLAQTVTLEDGRSVTALSTLTQQQVSGLSSDQLFMPISIAGKQTFILNALLPNQVGGLSSDQLSLEITVNGNKTSVLANLSTAQLLMLSGDALNLMPTDFIDLSDEQVRNLGMNAQMLSTETLMKKDRDGHTLLSIIPPSIELRQSFALSAVQKFRNNSSLLEYASDVVEFNPDVLALTKTKNPDIKISYLQSLEMLDNKNNQPHAIDFGINIGSIGQVLEMNHVKLPSMVMYHAYADDFGYRVVQALPIIFNNLDKISSDATRGTNAARGTSGPENNSTLSTVLSQASLRNLLLLTFATPGADAEKKGLEYAAIATVITSTIVSMGRWSIPKFIKLQGDASKNANAVVAGFSMFSTSMQAALNIVSAMHPKTELGMVSSVLMATALLEKALCSLLRVVSVLGFDTATKFGAGMALGDLIGLVGSAVSIANTVKLTKDIKDADQCLVNTYTLMQQTYSLASGLAGATMMGVGAWNSDAAYRAAETFRAGEVQSKISELVNSVSSELSNIQSMQSTSIKFLEDCFKAIAETTEENVQRLELQVVREYIEANKRGSFDTHFYKERLAQAKSGTLAELETTPTTEGSGSTLNDYGSPLTSGVQKVDEMKSVLLEKIKELDSICNEKNADFQTKLEQEIYVNAGKYAKYATKALSVFAGVGALLSAANPAPYMEAQSIKDIADAIREYADANDTIYTGDYQLADFAYSLSEFKMSVAEADTALLTVQGVGLFASIGSAAIGTAGGALTLVAQLAEMIVEAVTDLKIQNRRNVLGSDIIKNGGIDNYNLQNLAEQNLDDMSLILPDLNMSSFSKLTFIGGQSISDSVAQLGLNATTTTDLAKILGDSRTMLGLSKKTTGNFANIISSEDAKAYTTQVDLFQEASLIDPSKQYVDLSKYIDITEGTESNPIYSGIEFYNPFLLPTKYEYFDETLDGDATTVKQSIKSGYTGAQINLARDGESLGQMVTFNQENFLVDYKSEDGVVKLTNTVNFGNAQYYIYSVLANTIYSDAETFSGGGSAILNYSKIEATGYDHHLVMNVGRGAMLIDKRLDATSDSFYYREDSSASTLVSAGSKTAEGKYVTFEKVTGEELVGQQDKVIKGSAVKSIVDLTGENDVLSGYNGMLLQGADGTTYFFNRYSNSLNPSDPGDEKPSVISIIQGGDTTIDSDNSSVLTTINSMNYINVENLLSFQDVYFTLSDNMRDVMITNAETNQVYFISDFMSHPSYETISLNVGAELQTITGQAITDALSDAAKQLATNAFLSASEDSKLFSDTNTSDPTIASWLYSQSAAGKTTIRNQAAIASTITRFVDNKASSNQLLGTELFIGNGSGSQTYNADISDTGKYAVVDYSQCSSNLVFDFAGLGASNTAVFTVEKRNSSNSTILGTDKCVDIGQIIGSAHNDTYLNISGNISISDAGGSDFYQLSSGGNLEIGNLSNNANETDTLLLMINSVDQSRLYEDMLGNLHGIFDDGTSHLEFQIDQYCANKDAYGTNEALSVIVQTSNGSAYSINLDRYIQDVASLSAPPPISAYMSPCQPPVLHATTTI